MTVSRITRVAREVLLTFSAVVGALCLLLTAIGFAFGIHPLLFRSGSMSPTISTGDIAFSHSVPASQVHRGEIVSVISDSGQRVTHRVIDTTGTGSHRLLTLKGDANQVIDPKVYDVTSVQRVFFHVPKVGYAVSWLTTAPGVYLVAAYVALMLLLIGRSPGKPAKPGESAGPAEVVTEPVVDVEQTKPADQRRPAPRRAVPVLGALAVIGVLFAAVLVWAMPTWAAWTSSVPITGQALTTGTWGTPLTTCSVNSSKLTIVWKYPNASNSSDPDIKFTVKSNQNAALSTPTDVAKNLRTWTSPAFNSTSGQVNVYAVNTGPVEVLIATVNFTFGSGAGGGNKSCTPVL